ncbi:methionine adenosyltransferase domain-containing protein [Roseovarius salis]|uniref:methionine adenosyltransferase domain-containing protein n=1 Tax=Roseovarius salis TaxID=3376063 RepID=UPI0037C5A0BE
MRNFVMTSESVSVGHPDKLCDQISDAIVDAVLASGARSRINAECALATGVIFLSIHAGEELAIDPAAIARRVFAEAGYGASGSGAGPTVMLDVSVPGGRGQDGLAPALANQMVTAFGYACDATPEQLPLPIALAHRLCRAIDRARRRGCLTWISPDAQAQAAVRFADRRVVALDAIALRFGKREQVGEDLARATLTEDVIAPTLACLDTELQDCPRIITLGAEGEAGPLAHAGLTGRKSADDAYGSFIRRAGPALSGKDPARIDRIASYAARHAACNVLAAGLAREIEVQLSYLMGDEGPVSVEVDTFGSGAASDATISARLREKLDFRVAAIAERMDLWNLPAMRGGRFYRDLAVYGQMGRQDLSPPWEDTSVATDLA